MKESSPPVSAMATPTNSSGNVVDEFEEAFQHCLNVLTKDEALQNGDKDEAKSEVDQATMRFIDLARQMEAFFLQKRFLLSALKPEMVVKEDINELKIELARKDELLKRHYEKVNVWHALLNDIHGFSKSPGGGQTLGGVQCQPGMSTPGGVGGVAPGPIMVGASMPQQMANVQQSVNNNPMSGGTMTMQQQIQQLHQAQLQHQIQHQQLQQQQMQQLQVPGGMGGMGGGGGGVMVPGSQQAMFMQQAAMGGARAPPFGAQTNAAGVLQGPLAYLEKTTSNIDLVAGMTDGRR